jgi:hypothetical protein
MTGTKGGERNQQPGSGCAQPVLALGYSGYEPASGHCGAEDGAEHERKTSCHGARGPKQQYKY